jgi:hypothetical protein
MIKIAYATLLMALLACSSENANQDVSSTAADLPPVSAAGPDSGETAIPDTTLLDRTVGAFEIESCLELVNSGEFADAITVCDEAAKIAPENTEVRAALKEARAKVATIATPQTAAADAPLLFTEGDRDPPMRTPLARPPRP